MKKILLSLYTAIVFAISAPGAVFAADIASGEKNFNKCQSCHSIISDAGAVIIKGGRTGPNLYGVIGRVAGSADFRYGDAMKSLGNAGFSWTEAELAQYLTNPQAWLAAKTGDPGAKTTKTYKLHRGGADIAAYLASVSK